MSRERGPFDSNFEGGYKPMDEPPGFEEMEYKRWRKAGGVPNPTCTLVTRIPAALLTSRFGDLVRAMPNALGGHVYFVDAAQMRDAMSDEMSWLLDAPHWIPNDVFYQLNGYTITKLKNQGVSMMIYSSQSEAMSDLKAVWGEVRTK